MESKLKPDDFYNQNLVENVYYSEIKVLLLDYFNAKRVEIIEHVIMVPPLSDEEMSKNFD